MPLPRGGGGEESVDTERVLGGIGTLTGVASLVWHIVRLSEFKVTYFAVPPGWPCNFIGRAARTGAPAPVGTWFTSRVA